MATSSVEEFALSDPLIALVASLASCIDVADKHSLTTSGARTIAEQIREEVQRDAESVRTRLIKTALAKISRSGPLRTKSSLGSIQSKGPSP